MTWWFSNTRILKILSLRKRWAEKDFRSKNKVKNQRCGVVSKVSLPTLS